MVKKNTLLSQFLEVFKYTYSTSRILSQLLIPASKFIRVFLHLGIYETIICIVYCRRKVYTKVVIPIMVNRYIISKVVNITITYLV